MLLLALLRLDLSLGLPEKALRCAKQHYPNRDFKHSDLPPPPSDPSYFQICVSPLSFISMHHWKTPKRQETKTHFYADGLMPWSGWCSKQPRADLTIFGKETRREE
ncbi:putative DNA gyrase subunit B [Corchorus olitorius]|uniref:DNA gyrase subunit B n=1 Tax=Corchorus olitorius TaxID=93759 RepID=A0A1R3KDZ3_9ROSI|nr:putative DNA gyrase subunit B [Corchorus olitorius]